MTYLTPYRNPNRDFEVGFHHYEPFSTPSLSRLLSSFFDDRTFSVGRHFDLDENDDSYTLTLELPGFKQADLDVQINEGILSVSAKRKDASYQQSLVLPSGVDYDKVDAKLEDGLLTLTLPKHANAKPRKVEVK